jgi:type II secretory pathway pseudopilin PulG
MKKIAYQRSDGFTIIELCLSVGILALIVGMAMSSWVSFMQKTNRINAQASLDMEARRIIEHFRSEMSKTSRDSIIFYPRNQAPYQAVSFALPSDQDGDGLIDMNPATSNILWRQTIVYHIFNQGSKPPQMRRTQFSNRYQGATFEERYAQVERVVASGQGTDATLTGETASMKVMFENLFTGRLWHAEARFDGYAPTANTRERINFGVTPIQAGPQQVTFTVVDKNPLSTGRKIGLDRLAVSASGWFMEAELIPDAATIPKVYTGIGVASAGYGLLTATSANGQQVSLTLNNDSLEECIFIGEDRNVLFSNTVVRLDTSYVTGGFNDGVICSKLDGQCLKSWDANEQAMADATSLVYWSLSTNFWAVLRIPILSDQVLNAEGEPNEYGIRKSGFNPVFRLMKSKMNGGVVITHASFVIVPSGNLPANSNGTINNSAVGPIIGGGEIIPLQCWQNGSVTTWSNALPRTSAEASQLVEFHNTTRRNITVPMGSTLMLQLEIKVAPGSMGANYVELLRMNRTGLPAGSWFKVCSSPLEAVNLLTAPNWGSVSPSSFGYIPFLRSMVVNYPDEGNYISHVFDTGDTENKQKTMSWEALMPSGGGGALRMYARSGNSISANGFEIDDASSWATMSPVSDPPPAGGVSVGTGRYVQFKTDLQSQKSHLAPDTGSITASASPGPYRNDTPRLRWVNFKWPGPQKYVDVAAELLKGPDCGIFSVKVNGQELVRGVTMEIEIFKDIRGAGGVPLRITSAISAEVDPRNSGK